jgi:midasin
VGEKASIKKRGELSFKIVAIEHELTGKTKSLETAAQDVPRKRRKLEEVSRPLVSLEQWTMFHHDVVNFEANHVLGSSKAVFHFVEGPLVKALRQGDWYVGTDLI